LNNNDKKYIQTKRKKYKKELLFQFEFLLIKFVDIILQFNLKQLQLKRGMFLKSI